MSCRQLFFSCAQFASQNNLSLGFLTRSNTKGQQCHRRRLKASKCRFNLYYIIVNAQLICICVFAYAKCGFSHAAPHISRSDITCPTVHGSYSFLAFRFILLKFQWYKHCKSPYNFIIHVIPPGSSGRIQEMRTISRPPGKPLESPGC